MPKINEKLIEKMLLEGKIESEIIKILAEDGALIDKAIEEIKLREERLLSLISEGGQTALTVAIGDIDDIRKSWTDLKTMLQEKSVNESAGEKMEAPINNAETPITKEVAITPVEPTQEEKQAEAIAKV